ncbi:MAG: rane fusion protein multidrug efflux system [Phycisphaerales bacterium]|jgi:multidrug efflux system membrane fusion protein|nr:rane fusion protein multidrug efflux system [Phycisphaerales bacterium]
MRVVLALGVLTALALVVAGCHKDESAAAAAPARPPAMVAVAQVITRDVPIYLDEVGRTAPKESVTIQPQVTGKVTEVHFADGADVKKGQLLFTIDPRPFNATLAEAQAALAQARAQLKFSEDEVKRQETVRGTGAVSQQEFERAANAAAVAAAQVEAAIARVETAKLNLEYATIKSPIDGRAGQRLVDPGNVVSGGSDGTKMLVIQRFDPIYADFTVTENVLGTVRKFMADGVLATEDPVNKLIVLVDVPGDARQVIDALAGTKPTTAPAGAAPATQPIADRPVVPGSGSGPRTGPLTFLDNRVLEGSGTVKLRATIPNSDRYFWPGQFVRVRLVLTTKKNATLIPERAQQIGQQGPYVYVVKPDGTAEMRNITAGQRQPGELIVVNAGVQPGEQVIVEGHMAVMPGAKVTVLPPSPQQPTAPAEAGAASTKPADVAAAEGANRS